MAESLPLSIAIFNHGQWEALIDGRVKPAGTVPQVTTPADVYERMVRGLEYDVAEIAFTTFLAAKSFDIPISGIPVFSNRDVTMTLIHCNARSGINEPKDLEGKRVGLRAYTVTNNTQARGLLQSEFGVDTDKVTWVVTEDAHVAQYRNPANVEYAPPGKSLEEMLKAGEIDAGMQLRGLQPDGDITLLLTEEEANEVGLRFFRRTGVYPIGHVMTIKDETLAAHPWVAVEMFRAFTASKSIYLAGLDQRTTLTARDQQSLRNRELVGGDPLPFGLKRNRKALEAMIELDVRQRIIPKPFEVESLFAPNTLDLEEDDA
jgi:4,5-dihydroxyphthalate decarboxylase